MSMGLMLIAVAAVCIVITLKRPRWLGGPPRRYFADDTANATLNRSALRSFAGYLILAGALLWLFGL